MGLDIPRLHTYICEYVCIYAQVGYDALGLDIPRLHTYICEFVCIYAQVGYDALGLDIAPTAVQAATAYNAV